MMVMCTRGNGEATGCMAQESTGIKVAGRMMGHGAKASNMGKLKATPALHRKMLMGVKLV